MSIFRKKQPPPVPPPVKTLSESNPSESNLEMVHRIDDLERDIIEIHKQLNRIERKVYRQPVLDQQEYNNKDDNSWVKGIK
jgi:hypothetical protein